MIAVIDNYDSFTYNLVQYWARWAPGHVRRNDQTTVAELQALPLEACSFRPDRAS